MTDRIRVKKNKRDSEYVFISINDICIMKYFPDYTQCISHERDYWWPASEAGVNDILESYPFTHADRDVYVNIVHVKKIHSKMNLIIFEEVSSIKEANEKNALRTYLHHSHVYKFKEVLKDKENDLAYEKVKNKSRNARNPFTYKLRGEIF